MPGLVPGIHAFLAVSKDVDGRDKPGHDDREGGDLMDLLYKIFIDPFVQMGAAPDLLLQTLWDGLVSGVLYSLIALGFVLIFKASGVFNFAQGIMVVFAALTLVGLHEHGVPAFLALAITIARDVRARRRDRAADAAAVGQPARHHPVHGDLRADLFPDRSRRAGLRRRSRRS